MQPNNLPKITVLAAVALLATSLQTSRAAPQASSAGETSPWLQNPLRQYFDSKLLQNLFASFTDQKHDTEKFRSARQFSFPVTVNNVPLPMVSINESLPVTVGNSSLGVQVLNIPVPVNIFNQTVPVAVQGLPLRYVLANSSVPVSLLNNSLNVNVVNTPTVSFPQPMSVIIEGTPVETTFEQPVEITSNQLSSQLTNITNAVQSLEDLLYDQFTRPVCPTDSDFGTNTTAPCRRIGTQCYCFFTGITHNYTSARSFCEAAGFDGLVSLETLGEASAMADLLTLLGTQSGVTFFTSGYKKSTFQNYIWIPSGQTISLNGAGGFWKIGEPSAISAGIEQCVAIAYPDGRWDDTPCNVPTNFICEVGYASNAIRPLLPPPPPA